MTQTVPNEVPAEVREILLGLNSWDREELDIVECPERHPNREQSGETGGWITERKNELRQRGFDAVWNCEKQVYELRPIDATKHD